jgi:DNA polymerase III gamma/tau subunit
MTISTTIISKSYDGDGSNHSFAYNFKIFADADLTVIIRSSTGTETVKTLNTHYVVTGAGVSSGGNVLFKFNTGNAADAHYSTSDFRPASGETVVIRSELANTQTMDLVANDPFPAETLETNMDKLVRMVQQHDEELGRSLKLSRTNTMTSTEFTTSATDRASKLIAFDTSGELSIAQEIGEFQGDWAASTAYVQRDIVKDTSTNNIFIVNTAHTSSGAQPLTTNANSAKYDLLVDAASATTSATNAAASATTATTKASEASTSATNAGTSETNAANSATTATTKASEASTSATNAATSATTASTQATAASTSATAAASSATAAASSETAAASSETNAATSASTATTKASEASTSATNAAASATTATTQATTATTQATNAASSATAAAASAAAAATSADNFDDTYLGAKSSDPSVDNDGDALNAGDLYFNTTSNVLKVYSGSAWQNAAVDATTLATKGFATAMAIAL